MVAVFALGIGRKKQALNAPGVVMLNSMGWQFLFKDKPFEPGLEFELNDSRYLSSKPTQEKARNIRALKWIEKTYSVNQR